MRKAIITGINGQDGAYLCRLLLAKNYRVYGIVKSSERTLERLISLNIIQHENLSIINCDVSDYESVNHLLKKIEPDEIYNLAAYSFVADSYNNMFLLHSVTASAPLNIVESIRSLELDCKIFQASSSEIFGHASVSPQNENTEFNPRNPYGVAKLYAHQMLEMYRKLYGLPIVIGILYNHESPLRSECFVTRKITSTVAAIFNGRDCVLELGNLDALRDWGDAEEYVLGIWRSMQHSTSDTYIFATGKEYSVRDFVSYSFASIGISIIWNGVGLNEVGCDKSGRVLVKVNEEFYRATEKVVLVGDADKAYKVLSWKANKPLNAICEKMVAYDLLTKHDLLI